MLGWGWGGGGSVLPGGDGVWNVMECFAGMGEGVVAGWGRRRGCWGCLIVVACVVLYDEEIPPPRPFSCQISFNYLPSYPTSPPPNQNIIPIHPPTPT